MEPKDITKIAQAILWTSKPNMTKFDGLLQRISIAKRNGAFKNTSETLEQELGEILSKIIEDSY